MPKLLIGAFLLLPFIQTTVSAQTNQRYLSETWTPTWETERNTPTLEGRIGGERIIDHHLVGVSEVVAQ